MSLALFLWCAFLAVGAVDAIYFHGWTLQLHRDDKARAEHLVHAVRALLVAPVLLLGFVFPPAKMEIWLGGLLLVDLALLIADVWLERTSRAHLGGLSHGEYTTHVAATLLHAGAWTALWLSPPTVSATSTTVASGLATLSASAALLHVLAMVPAQRFRRAGAALLALLCLARPRTWSFASLAFLAAAIPGGASLAELAAGVLVACALTAFANLLNVYTDRTEDAVNLPLRAALLAEASVPGLLGACAGLVALALGIGVAVGPLYLALVVLGAANGLFYSMGPRLKARALLSLVAFAGIVTVAFASGCAMTGVWPTDAAALALVLGASFFAYGTLKNVPDAQGDRVAGVRTLFTILSTERAILASTALLLLPYLVLCGAVLRGALPLRTVAALNGVFVVLALAFRMRSDDSPRERECSHAFGFYYELGFLVLLFTAFTGAAAVAWAGLGLFSVSVCFDRARLDSRPYELNISWLCGRPVDNPSPLEMVCPFQHLPALPHGPAPHR